MKTNQNFTIHNKSYQLIKILYKIVKNFPKEYKFSLGKEMIDLVWQCLDNAIEANNMPDDKKKNKIKELSTSFDKLKMRIRMGQEINLLSIGQFSHLEENYILDIGREIGGWLKWANGVCDTNDVNAEVGSGAVEV